MDARLAVAGVLASGLLLLAKPVGVVAAEEPAAAPAAAAPPAAAAQEAAFTADQLDQLVAPVALYPDPLLSQVLMASTYPLEVVEADRWRRKNAELKDDALDKALGEQDWDPSVQGLTRFPDLLKRMSENLDWTKDLGDAFLGQQKQVMDAVQRMRVRAEEAGTLKTSKEQTVIREKETIVIEPAAPQTVYVPTYPPTAYGPTYAPATPYYPTAVYGYSPGAMATASFLSFGAGVATAALIGGGFDWDDNDCHVNNNYYGGGGGGGGGGSNTNVNVNVDKTKIKNKNWEHKPEHRRNVGYRDKGTGQRYEGGDRTAARQRQDREAARGFDRGAASGRPGAAGQRPAGGGGAGTRPATPDRGGGRAGTRPATPDRGGGAQARGPGQATSGGKQGAFGGYGNEQKTRQASSRGAASRGSQSYAGGSRGGGGRGGGGGGGQRGGGGGGGRGGGGGGGGGRKR